MLSDICRNKCNFQLLQKLRTVFKFLHGVRNIMSDAFQIWFLFFLMTWNVCAVTVFVIFYIQAFIWNVLAHKTAHRTKFQVPLYNGSSFDIQLRNYVQFVHLVHSILTWMICNRSYILYFFINLCIVQQFIVLYLVLCLKVMWKPSWRFVTLISAGTVCFLATGFIILLEFTMTTYKSPVHFILDKVEYTPYIVQLLFLWETIRLIWRRNMHH